MKMVPETFSSSKSGKRPLRDSARDRQTRPAPCEADGPSVPTSAHHEMVPDTFFLPQPVPIFSRPAHVQLLRSWVAQDTSVALGTRAQTGTFSFSLAVRECDPPAQVPIFPPRYPYFSFVSAHHCSH
jgi:hypothetical protein